MAKASGHEIVTFQRKPGRWRANVTPIIHLLRQKIAASKKSAVIAADQAIKALDS
jgi:hypothetical protein